jgi:hypothetical protein
VANNQYWVIFGTFFENISGHTVAKPKAAANVLKGLRWIVITVTI